uniref:Uncharacterized protein n=1 Tax=Timema monikensis TaxID=170555 RepID=A0A7R9EJC3_9NEOP|nr:unnamed protein product [Timema monikensis]
MLINEQPIEEQKDDEPSNRITHSEGNRGSAGVLWPTTRGNTSRQHIRTYPATCFPSVALLFCAGFPSTTPSSSGPIRNRTCMSASPSGFKITGCLRKANVRLSPTCEAVCWSGAGIESWAEKESSTIKSSSEDLKEPPYRHNKPIPSQLRWTAQAGIVYDISQLQRVPSPNGRRHRFGDSTAEHQDARKKIH